MAKEKVYFIPEGSPVAPHKFDVKVRVRNLTNGVISHEEVNRYKESLPDDTEHAELRSYDAVVHDDGSEGASQGGTPEGGLGAAH